MSGEPGLCSACGKGFRGWEPLSDGKGKLFHKKCAPKPDLAGMLDATARFFGDHGVKEVEFVDGDGRRRGGFKIPKKYRKGP